MGSHTAMQLYTRVTTVYLAYQSEARMRTQRW